MAEFKALGNAKATGTDLEVFPVYPGPTKTLFRTCTLTSDEMGAVCPVTGQPDWYTIEVYYEPIGVHIESKSFKLFIQSFRNKGAFCESLSQIILDKVVEATKPHYASVKLIQKPRGGVSITSFVSWSKER